MSLPLQTIFMMRSMASKAVAKGATGKNKTERIIAKHKSALTTIVAKVLQDQGKRIAKQMAARYAKHMEKATLPSWAEELVDEVDTDGVGIAVRLDITPKMLDIFKQSGLTALAEVDQEATGEMLQHMDVEAARWASKRGAELVTDISGTTRDQLRGLTEDAIEEGLSPQAFASQIESSTAFDESRAEMIARTELAFSHVQGNLAGYKASGVVGQKRWLANADACEICAELDGTTVDLDDDFDADGEAIDGPPAHPHCECDVIPVLSDEEE